MSISSELRRAYLFLKNIKKLAIHDCNNFTRMANRVQEYTGNDIGYNVLDIGCGIRYPWTLLFHSYDIKVIGIDITSPRYNSREYSHVLQNHGLTQFIKRIVMELLINKIYHSALGEAAGIPMKFNNLDLREMDAANTPYANEEFDLIISNAVFEHLNKPEQVLREMKRIMKDGAIAHIGVHLFPSLTGGHNTIYDDPDIKEVVLGEIPAWDHLRQNLFPSAGYLNKLREADWIEMFSKHFEILQCIKEYTEPDTYLTTAISNELPQYTRDELLNRSIIIIARKYK